MLKSKTDRTSVLLTREVYERVTASPEVRQLCTAIAATTDDAVKQRLKGQLQAVIWMAEQPADCVRPKKDTARPNGLCMHDLDHLKEPPQTVYEQQIRPHIAELGIVLVHTSPRREGLRIITLLPEGWTPEECQIWVAQKCGLAEYRDPAVTDYSRLGYVVSDEMHLYLDHERLWWRHTEQPFITTDPRPATAVVREPTLFAEAEVPAVNERTLVPVPNCEVPTMYQGQIPYAVLVPRIISHLGGLPTSFGNRHQGFKEIAKALASVMDYQPAIVLHYLEPYRAQADQVPGFAFSVAELRELVAWVCRAENRNRSGALRREVRQAIVEANSQQASANSQQPTTDGQQPTTDGNEDETDDENLLAAFTHRQLVMPRMPAGLATVVSIYPPGYRPQIALSTLPTLMFLADGVKYDDLTGNERTLQSHLVVVGNPSSNKGWVVKTTELLLQSQMERERQELLKLEENRKELRRAARSGSRRGGGDTVQEYEAEVRVLPPATSVTEYMRLQSRAGDQSLLMYTPEISNITAACGSGSWADLRTVFREGWDGDYHGQMRATETSWSGRVRVRLCVMAAGTPGQAFGYRGPDGRWRQGFYQSKEDGLASRLFIVYMPNVMGEELVRKKRYTDAQLAEIERMTLKLESEQGHLMARRLEKTMREWTEEMRQITLRVGGGLIDEFRKRSALNGLACGYLAYLLEGRKDNRTVSEWARYCADLCLQNLLLAYADQENNGASLMPNAVAHRWPVRDLLASLPETFTLQMVKAVRQQQGKGDNVKSLLNRLVCEGLVEYVDKGSGIYQKTNKK